MTVDTEAKIEGMPQRRSLLRAYLLTMPLLLFLPSVVLLCVTPFSWGAAEVLEIADWIPPVNGLVLATAGILISVYTLRVVVRATEQDFDVFAVQLVFGSFMFLVGAALVLSFAYQLPNEATYGRALDDNGDFEVGPTIFVLGTAFMICLSMAWVWAAAYLYAQAISNQKPNRISDRPPGEVDGVGELLRKRS